ncbi:MAG TPA: FAD-dependent oxidoreductase [Myxococcaceae bacterium]|nr:FAD-dependent oxidoreductase [Myxococcaceae bacterium]
MDPVVILGGGLAGLSTAVFLQRPWLLVEREERTGGLTRTDVIHGGFHFDPTGHWLHLRDPEMVALVTGQWLPGALVTIARRAAVFSHGVFTRFPYQVNTHGLPPEVVAENLLGFVEATLGEAGRELRSREPRNFEEFILRHLGTGFARNFMVPYNTKLWTVPPSRLSAAWCGRFVPKPSLREVIEGALGLGGDQLGYNATFVYPRSGGIEALPRALAARARGGEIRLRTAPTAIDWRGRTVTLDSGQTQRFAALVSTIALTELVALLARGTAGVPDAVRAAAARLRATTVTYVRVGVRGRNRQPWHWVYLPEPEFQSYRIGSPSAVHPPLAPAGSCSFYVEYSHHGERTRAACEAAAAEDLLRSQMIHAREDVLFAEAVEIPHAYVLYDDAYGPAKKEVVDFLEGVGIHTAGRYGRWEYSSMEDALLAGRACAERLNPPPG